MSTGKDRDKELVPDRALPQGKLPAALLARLLKALPVTDALVGPRAGEDAAVIAAPEGYLVVTSDPITLTATGAGRQAVIVNANDIAAMGGEPRWLLATVLLPPGTPIETVEQLFADLVAACGELGISLVGGHTEVTDAVSRVVVGGTMLGVVAPDRLVTSTGARPGDVLLLSKPVAIEGTALLGRDAAEALQAAGLSPEVISSARALLDRPGIGILPEARLLRDGAPAHAMHDVTEGGLATALRELAEASSVGLRVDRAAIPLLPECEEVCAALGVDPLGLLGSGSMLAAIAPEEAMSKLAELRGAGLAAAAIGVVTSGTDLVLVEPDGSLSALPEFARDELARYFEQRR